MKMPGNEVKRVFSTFKEASIFAKQHPRSRIVRDESGTGFVVK